MMKLIKITFLVLLASIALMLVLSIALLFSPGFQKQVVLRAFREAHGPSVQLDYLHFGPTSGEIRQLFILDGQQGISLEKAAFDYSLFSLLFRKELHVERCELKGLLIDVSQPGQLIQVSGNVDVRIGSGGDAAGDGVETQTDNPAEEENEQDETEPGQVVSENERAHPSEEFRYPGLLAATRAIGLKYRLENVDLEGKILLPEGRELTFSSQAEGVAPGATGGLRASLEFTDKSPTAQISRLQGTGSLEVSQSKDPGVEALKGEWQLQASGMSLLQPVALSISMETQSTMESDTGRLVFRLGAAKTPVMSMEFEQKHFRREAGGRWHIDLDLADVRVLPQTMALPPLKIQGQGTMIRDEMAGTGETRGDWKVWEKTAAGDLAVLEGSLLLQALSAGTIQGNLPLKINGPGGLSDLLLQATVQRQGQRPRWEAEITSEQILADDLQAIAKRWFAPSGETSVDVAVEKEDTPPVEAKDARSAPGKTVPAEPSPVVVGEPVDMNPAPDLAPFWKDQEGKAEVKLKRIVFQGKRIEAVGGKLTIDGHLCRWENLQASLGGQTLQGEGELEFIPGTPFPYQLASSASISALNVGQLLSQLQPGVTPMLETKGELFLEWTGAGANPRHLAETMRGSLHLKTREGVFHPLAAGGENVERGAAIAGLAGALLGKQLGGGVAALPGLLDSLRDIPFRSFEMKAVRQRNLDFTLETFDLRSPELRFTGVGGISYQPGTPIVDQPLGVGLTFAFPGDGTLAAKFNEARLLDGRRDADGFYIGPTFQLVGSLRQPSTNLASVLKDAITRGLTAQPLSLEKPQP